MKFKRYHDGIRWGRLCVRWSAGVCSPAFRSHVFLLSITDERLSVQVWSASVWVEVFLAPSEAA